MLDSPFCREVCGERAGCTQGWVLLTGAPASRALGRAPGPVPCSGAMAPVGKAAARPVPHSPLPSRSLPSARPDTPRPPLAHLRPLAMLLAICVGRVQGRCSRAGVARAWLGAPVTPHGTWEPCTTPHHKHYSALIQRVEAGGAAAPTFEALHGQHQMAHDLERGPGRWLLALQAPGIVLQALCRDQGYLVLAAGAQWRRDAPAPGLGHCTASTGPGERRKPWQRTPALASFLQTTEILGTESARQHWRTVCDGCKSQHWANRCRARWQLLKSMHRRGKGARRDQGHPQDGEGAPPQLRTMREKITWGSKRKQGGGMAQNLSYRIARLTCPVREECFRAFFQSSGSAGGSAACAWSGR